MKNRFLRCFRSPILWGGLISVIFYTAIRQSIITNEFIIRYCAGHPIEYITISMFLIGMADLFFKYRSVYREKKLLKLGPVFAAIKNNQPKEKLSKIDEFIETVHEAEKLRGSSLHVQRLLNGLMFLKNNGSVNDLDQELRLLSEEDAIRADEENGMIRMFIWAIPILGFLGTVIGITMALGNLDLTELETSGKLLADGLKIAFDTTALALTLVFVLYFTLFGVSAQKSKFFEQLDKTVEKELCGRFLSENNITEKKEFQVVTEMFQSIIQTFERSLSQQFELWSKTAHSMDERSFHLAQEASVVMETVLSESLQKQTQLFLQNVNNTQNKELLKTISPLIDSMERTTKQLLQIENQIVHQSKTLNEVIRTTSDISQRENQPNSNLCAVAENNRFEKILNNLTTTMQLLNSKLTDNSLSPPNIGLQENSKNNDKSLMKKDDVVVIPFAHADFSASSADQTKDSQTLTAFSEKQTKSNSKNSGVSAKKENKQPQSKDSHDSVKNNCSKILKELEQISVVTDNHLS